MTLVLNSYKKRAVLFGTGKVYSTFIKLYDETKIEIIGLCDNDKNKHGQVLDGITVYEPYEICEMNIDMIIITTAYVDEICNQLVSMGIPNDIIYNFYAMYKRLLPLDNGIWNYVLKEDVINNLLAQKEHIVNEFSFCVILLFLFYAKQEKLHKLRSCSLGLKKPAK